jgi:hypothetical protein
VATDATELDLEDARKIVEETHLYLRHTVQLWVQWFTFFLTVNYVALGWFASGANSPSNRKPLVYVATLFITQNTLGIIACLSTRKWLDEKANELDQRYRALGTEPPPFAHEFSRFAILLGAVALAIVAVTWIAFAVLA